MQCNCLKYNYLIFRTPLVFTALDEGVVLDQIVLY